MTDIKVRATTDSRPENAKLEQTPEPVAQREDTSVVQPEQRTALGRRPLFGN